MLLHRLLVLLAAVLLAPTLFAADKYWVFIGTYTSKDGSKGIYRCELDVKTGGLSAPELAAEVGSPSFLTISSNGKFLYAVGETSGKDGGGVYAYAIDPPSGKLTKLNETTSGGAGPCHISVNRTGRYALVANYGGGSSAVFKIGDDGKLGDRTDFRQHEGKSANAARQEKPHAHCGVFRSTADGEFAYVVDLGVDKVFSYKLDETSGKLEPTKPGFVELPPGSGPRHIAFHKDAGKAFVCGELTSTVITLRAYDSNGTLQMYGTGGLAERKDAVLSTLPNNVAEDVRKKNSTAEVVVHPTSPHVLVSNRGHNSLAVFKFNADQTEAAGHITSASEERKIATPRNFNIDPTGKWVLIANQDGGSVEVAEWDATGNGKLTGHAAKVSKPVCVKFLAKP